MRKWIFGAIFLIAIGFSSLAFAQDTDGDGGGSQPASSAPTTNPLESCSNQFAFGSAEWNACLSPSSGSPAQAVAPTQPAPVTKRHIYQAAPTIESLVGGSGSQNDTLLGGGGSDNLLNNNQGNNNQGNNNQGNNNQGNNNQGNNNQGNNNQGNNNQNNDNQGNNNQGNNNQYNNNQNNNQNNQNGDQSVNVSTNTNTDTSNLIGLDPSDEMVACRQITVTKTGTPSVAPGAVDQQALLQDCQDKAQIAENACVETKSVPLQSAMALIGGGTSGISIFKNMVDVCSKQAEYMRIAEMAASAYNVACGAALAVCDNSCSKLTDAKSSVDQRLQGKVKNTCLKACNQYQYNIGAAGAAIAQFVSSKMAAQKCKEQTATTTVVDCSNPANVNNTTCICIRDPRATGCSGAVVAASAKATGVGAAAPAVGSNGGNLGGLPLGPDLPPTTPPSNGSDSTPGGGILGGALPQAGAGGGHPAEKGLPVANKAMDYYGGGDGGYGGGGGGGKGAGGSTGYADPAAGAGGIGATANKYSKYLPQRGVAGVGDITGKSGKSNWEKVRQTYVEQSPKLLSN